MPLPKNIAAVIDKPGKYLFQHPFNLWFFRVTEHGDIYQLALKNLKDDGLLDEDGWNIEQAETGKVFRLEEI